MGLDTTLHIIHDLEKDTDGMAINVKKANRTWNYLGPAQSK